MASEIVTPDGITEGGKKYVWEKLAGKYSPEDIKDILNTIDKESRSMLLERSAGTKLSDAFKHALPLAKSTGEKMSKEYAQLFERDIPQDIETMKLQIKEIAKKPY